MLTVHVSEGGPPPFDRDGTFTGSYEDEVHQSQSISWFSRSRKYMLFCLDRRSSFPLQTETRTGYSFLEFVE